MNGRDEVTKVKLFLYLIGSQGREIYDTLAFEIPASERTLTQVLQAFDGHCNPRKNETVERFKFFSRNQEPGESQETVSAASSQQSFSASGVSRNSDSVGVWKRHGGFGASGHSDTIVDDADGVSQSNVSSGPQITDSQGAEQVTSNDVNAASPVGPVVSSMNWIIWMANC